MTLSRFLSCLLIILTTTWGYVHYRLTWSIFFYKSCFDYWTSAIPDKLSYCDISHHWTFTQAIRLWHDHWTLESHPILKSFKYIEIGEIYVTCRWWFNKNGFRYVLINSMYKWKFILDVHRLVILKQRKVWMSWNCGKAVLI